MRTLFDLRPQFQLAQLTAHDVEATTDHLITLKDLILMNEDMYPGIDKWWVKKVVPGLKREKRIAWVGYEGEIPVASAILKKGPASKFCHVRIHEGFRDLKLGEVFFSLMTLNVRHSASEIHFTLPESLWIERSEFFRSFGFSSVLDSPIQYRKGETELRCSAAFRTVWGRVVQKLPLLRHTFSVGSYGSNLVMSMKPEFAERVFSGEKRVEVRRGGLAKKWKGERVTIYASSPVCHLLGEVRVREIEVKSPQEIWDLYEAIIGCSREQFEEYTKGAGKAAAIVFDEIRPFRYPVPLFEVADLIQEDLKPPQSHLSLKTNNRWAKAVSVANLLHGNFAKSAPVIFL